MKFIKSLKVPKDLLKGIQDATLFVPQNNMWYGYLVPKAKREELELSIFEITMPDGDANITVAHIGKECLCSNLVSINSLIHCTKGTEYSVMIADKMGYIDEVSKNKYLSTPVDNYWDYSNNPIIMKRG